MRRHHRPVLLPAAACAAVSAAVVAIVVGVALLGAGSSAAGRPTSVPAPLAAPAPAPPRLLFREDFEAVSGGTWQSLTSYPGAAGVGYTATTYWSAPEMCNGLVTLHAPPSPASPCPQHADIGVASEQLPQARGAAATTSNHALAWYSYDPDAAHPMAPGDVLLRTVGGIPVPASGRFLRVAFDGAGMQCPHPAPLLRLTVDESGAESDPWAAPVELCTDPRSADVGASAFGRVRVGRYESESAVRVLSSRVDLVVRDGDPGTPGHYNDGGIDELRVLDVTPALHVDYVETGPVTTGRTATLRFAVVNSADLLAKDGWGFRDDLPAGLSVAGPPTTTCPATTVTAPGGGSAVQVDAGRLDAGLASCEVRVPVTTQQAGTYAAGTVQRTALEAPGTASVQFVAPAPPPATAGPGAVPSPGGTSLPKSTSGATSDATADATGDTASSTDASSAVDPIGSASADPSADATAATDASQSTAGSGPDEGQAPGLPADRPARTGSDSEPYSPGYDVDRSRPEAPSVLTEQLPSILDVVRDPALIASALAGGLVWTLGLVVTTGTLNRALKTRYDRVAALAGRLGARPLVARITHVLGSGHWLVIVGLLAVNATVLAFVDPHLGMNASSVRLVVSIATAQLICGVVPYLIAGSAARARWQIPARIRTLPLGLLLGLVGVGASRLIGFVPGLLTGATLGLATPGASVEHEVRLERIQAWTSLGIAAVAWPLSTLIPTDEGWPLVMAHDTAVAVTISAILGTLIDLLPFAAFPGGLLKEHARWTWAGLTALTWTAFMAFVMPQSRYWLDVGDHVGRWITVAAVAMVAGIAVVVLLHRRDVRARTAAV